jgi:hypothetical protein
MQDDNRSDDRIAPREAQDDPHRLSAVYMRRRGLQPRGWSLKFWRGQWWAWDGRRYRIVPDLDVRGDVTNEIKAEFDRSAQTAAASDKPFVIAKVTSALVSNVLNASRGRALIPADVEQPAWVGHSKGLPPGDRDGERTDQYRGAHCRCGRPAEAPFG